MKPALAQPRSTALQVAFARSISSMGIAFHEQRDHVTPAAAASAAAVSGAAQPIPPTSTTGFTPAGASSAGGGLGGQPQSVQSIRGRGSKERKQHPQKQKQGSGLGQAAQGLCSDPDVASCSVEGTVYSPTSSNPSFSTRTPDRSEQERVQEKSARQVREEGKRHAQQIFNEHPERSQGLPRQPDEHENRFQAQPQSASSAFNNEGKKNDIEGYTHPESGGIPGTGDPKVIEFFNHPQSQSQSQGKMQPQSVGERREQREQHEAQGKNPLSEDEEPMGTASSSFAPDHDRARDRGSEQAYRERSADRE